MAISSLSRRTSKLGKLATGVWINGLVGTTGTPGAGGGSGGNGNLFSSSVMNPWDKSQSASTELPTRNLLHSILIVWPPLSRTPLHPAADPRSPVVKRCEIRLQLKLVRNRLAAAIRRNTHNKPLFHPCSCPALRTGEPWYLSAVFSRSPATCRPSHFKGLDQPPRRRRIERPARSLCLRKRSRLRRKRQRRPIHVPYDVVYPEDGHLLSIALPCLALPCLALPCQSLAQWPHVGAIVLGSQPLRRWLP